jgi:PAS domain S-box-containing protein
VFTEEQIREIMHRVDKYTPEDELNCGACGYATCREKAMATLRGMAEATMCIPYMRRRAESLRQVVMDVTPNAILIVDTGLHIQEMSPSAETMLGCHFAAVRGKPLQTVMPVVDAFARVRETQFPILSETVRLRDDLVVEQTIVPVQGQSLMLGILRNVTDRERQNAELEHLRRETLLRTQEVVRNQMRVAQEIAQLLGETTAETKMMLSRLARLVDEGNGP